MTESDIINLLFHILLHIYLAKFDIHTYGSLNYVYVTYDNLFKQIKDLVKRSRVQWFTFENMQIIAAAEQLCPFPKTSDSVWNS